MTNMRIGFSRNKKPRVFIWGASGHAKVVTDILRLRDEYVLVGFVDDVNPDRKSESFYGSIVLGGAEQLDILLQQGIDHFIIGFGNNHRRQQAALIGKRKGYKLITAIHPKSIIAGGSSIGLGTVITAGVIICPDCQIGENVILNTASVINHDNIIRECVHISPGVHLGGNVVIGKTSWIGIGAIIKNEISIGSESIVGAGSLVLKDIPDRVVAFGSPANVVRRTEKDET